jgi:DNA polymerase-3 subunit delta'
MSWQNIFGHDRILACFQRCIARGRLPSSFLFVGPAGIGKRTFAMQLAEALLCPNTDLSTLEACGCCDSCRQVQARSHLDFELIELERDKSHIRVEALIGGLEHRMREGLLYRLAMKSFHGGRKVVIIEDADHLNRAGTSALLKTLEELSADTIIILIGTSRHRQLPTIQSRCQVIRFQPLDAEIVAKLLLDQDLVPDTDQARRVAEMAGGSIGRAADLVDPELWAFRGELHSVLQRRIPDPTAFTKELIEFVDAVGHGNMLRRCRLHQVLLFATEFYRQQLRESIGDSNTETLNELIDCGLEAMSLTDQNANLATLQHWWVDELAHLNARLASNNDNSALQRVNS